MRSATLKALALAALLAVAAPAIAVADGGQQALASVRQVDAATTSAGKKEDVSTADGSEDGTLSYQALSTLGALALGVLGLLWVRRHTAEL